MLHFVKRWPSKILIANFLQDEIAVFFSNSKNKFDYALLLTALLMQDYSKLSRDKEFNTLCVSGGMREKGY